MLLWYVGRLYNDLEASYYGIYADVSGRKFIIVV